jgi:hypothetical protein
MDVWAIGVERIQYAVDARKVVGRQRQATAVNQLRTDVARGRVTQRL